MTTYPIERYRRLRHLLPFEQLADKLYGVLVFACTMPLTVVVGMLLLAPAHWQPHTLIACTATATVATLGLSIWLAHAILAPVSLSRLALHAYRREQRLLPLPQRRNAGLLLQRFQLRRAAVRHVEKVADHQLAQVGQKAGEHQSHQPGGQPDPFLRAGQCLVLSHAAFL